MILIVVLLFVLVRKRRVRQEEEAEEAESAAAGAAPEVVTVDFRPTGQAGRLASSFSEALRQLRSHLRGSAYRYRMPWFLLLGETATGKSDLLARSGLNLPLGPPEEGAPEEGPGCSWWFCDQGIVLDVAGDLVLSANGGGSDEKSWRLLLRLLQKHRPERPIDGVVLAVPAADLLGRQADPLVAQKATALYTKLRRAQKQLGMTFPVYVLVTGCERIPGFNSLFMEIPESLHGEIFGWSNPYTLETAYRADWVDEAFESLTAGLERTQLQVFGERIQIDEPDGVFGFPSEVQGLKEPLRTFLGQVFRPSAYHEPLFFRGLYLCGTLPEGAPSASAGKALFVRQVFEAKVFPERSVARPSAGTLASRNRAVLAAQCALVALTLILGLGLWWAHARLSESQRFLQTMLTETARDVTLARQKQRSGLGLGEAFLKEETFRMFDSMALIDTSRFGSVFIPSSWFSPFNSRLRDSMRLAFEDIIFESMYRGLQHRAETLLDQGGQAVFSLREEPLAIGADIPIGDPLEGVEETLLFEEPPDAFSRAASLERLEIVPVEQTAELAELRSFVHGFVRLEENAERYNKLTTTQDLKELDELVFYLFGQRLPKEFFSSSRLYRRSLKDVRYKPFDPQREEELSADTLQKRARVAAVHLVDRLLDRLFLDNPFLLHGEILAAEIQEVGGSGVAGASNPERLLELLALLTRTKRVLARPELAWVSKPDFDLGEEFKDIVETGQSTVCLGPDPDLPDLETEILGKGRERLFHLSQALGEVETPYTGPILAREEGTGKWSLAPGLEVLETALTDMVSQKFMSPDALRSLRTELFPGTRLVWDVRLLREAGALYEPYETFVANSLGMFPQSLRSSLQIVARNRLASKMIARIAAAQRLERTPEASSALLLERELEAEVENFRAAGPALGELIALFDRLGLTDSRDALASLVAAQGYQLLLTVDRLLAEEALYAPKGDRFAWWEGSKGVTLEAYDARDPGELAVYLDAQRDRIAAIALDYAEPVIKGLGGQSRAGRRELRALIARWEGILAELRKYEGKKPGNSVAALEAAILTELSGVDTSNCLQTLTPRMLSEPAGDFFLKARSTLRRGVYDRCQVLAEDRAVSGYRRIASAFNQRLAGRFPFADEIPGRVDREADPDEIRAFFQVFDAHAGILRALPPDDPRFGSAGPAVARFVDRMTDVRALFAPFLDGPKRTETPVFDFELEFRVNRKNERGANQIIGWEMTSGSDRFTLLSEERRGRWSPGVPVALSLRWAKDAVIAPAPPAGGDANPHLRVVDRKVSYSYGGRWGLFALLRDNASSPADFDGFADPHPQTLRFTVATRREDGPEATASAAAERTEPVRTFVRVTLLTPDRKEDLVLPEFPSRAPDLDARPEEKAEMP